MEQLSPRMPASVHLADVETIVSAVTTDSLTQQVKQLTERLESQEAALKKIGKDPAEAKADAQAKDAEEEKAEEEGEDHAISVNFESVANLYSYGMEAYYASESTFRQLSCFGFLCLLTFVQMIFSYGVYDWAMAFLARDNTPAFLPPVDIAHFYPDNSIKGVPTINIITSVVALALMSMMAKEDNQGTLYTHCPLEDIMLPAIGEAKSKGVLGWIVKGCHAIGFQFFWIVRACFTHVGS